MNNKIGDVKSSIMEKDVYTSKIKRSVDNWRELALLLYSVVMWKKNTYPWIIAAIVTFIFLEIAYYEPSLVTVASLSLMFVTIANYLGPMLSGVIWRAENWTATKERELENMCRSMASVAVGASRYYSNLMEVKAARPNLYYPVAIGTLCILAWIGNSVNNLFLTYIFVLFALMAPGLIQQDQFKKMYDAALGQVASLLRTYSSSKPAKKDQ